MRKVFSSPRLENAEGVATLLREAGIEVRITNGRSYKGSRRRHFSYSDPSAPESAVWVVRSDQQAQARTLLRQGGLIDSTRPGSHDEHGYAMPTFRTAVQLAHKTPARKRLTRIKLGLLGLIAAVMVAGMIHTINQPPAPPSVAVEPQLAVPPFDGSIAATLAPVARVVFASELGSVDTPVACLGVDGGDASPALIASLPAAKPTLVPATACVEIADEDQGSRHRASGQLATILDVAVFRPAAPDRGTVQITAYHHRGWASYKTLEVSRHDDGQWQVDDVIKHVESRGLMQF
ncbi:hypothetical protein [Lysobacter sp. A289]